MGRTAKLWKRADRPGWWATIGGKQVCFGTDHGEALKAFHAAKARREEPKPRSRVLVARAVDRFLAEAEGRLKPKTHRLYRIALQHWVNAHGRRPCEELTAEDLEDWLKAHAGWSGSTRHDYGAVVKIWARWCARKKYLAPYPFDGVTLPPIAVRKAAPAGALEALIAGAEEDPAFRDFLIVCWETGARPGEIRTLEAHQVAQDRTTAIVVGKTGERLIGLSDRVARLLEPLLAKHPSGPILRDALGRPWDEGLIWRRMDALRKKLGLEKVVIYHARHAFWARAKKGGAGDIQIARQLGHRNLKMLLERYAHEDHEIMRETARKASGEG